MTGSADLMEGLAALNKAAPGYLRADNYATGVIPERFSSPRIRTLLAGSGDAYRFRLARKPITALTNRIGIGSITGSSEAINAKIEEIRRANDMATQEPHLIERAATYGDAYWFVWPVDPDEPDEAVDGEKVDTPADADLRAAGVEIAYQSPLSCRAMYDAEDGRRMRYTIRRWQEAWPLGKVWRAEVWYADRLEAWHSDPDTDGSDPTQWHPYAEDESGEQVPATGDNWPEDHDAGRIPFAHMRTDLPYGRPQHIDAYGPQDAITKAIVTQVEVDLEAHGWPERWRLTDDKAVQDTARDTVNWQDDTKATSATASVSGRRSGPGTEQVYEGTKSVGEYTPPDPSILIPVITQWVQLMSTATDTPAWEFDPNTGHQMSGIARWRAERPLRDRERTFKRYLLQFLRESYGLALGFVGMDAGDLDVEWTPQEVEADPEWWAVAASKREAGVPLEQILTEAGYTPDQVADFLDADNDQRFWSERVATLAKLAEALNMLTGPVGLGIIDAAKVSALVDKIMKDAGEPGIGGDGEKDEPEPVAVVPAQPGGPVVPE